MTSSLDVPPGPDAVSWLAGPRAAFDVETTGLQVGWAAEQAASFQEYLRRSNPDAVVDGRWPVGR